MITALILAAGQSKRMGQQKMLLRWGNRTVLEKVIAAFKAPGIDDILVITGGDRERIEALVRDSARTLFNPDFAEGEMLSSVQVGLAGLKPGTEAVLIGLGDQPQVQEGSVLAVVDKYNKTKANLVVPSYRMRRGHPWLIPNFYWDEIRNMRPPATLRDLLNRHANEIQYVELETDSILQDLDTPEDYIKSRP